MRANSLEGPGLFFDTGVDLKPPAVFEAFTCDVGGLTNFFALEMGAES